MNRVYVPAGGVDAWRERLSEPDKHWRPNYSAHSLAHAWHGTAALGDGFPKDVSAVLATSPSLSGAELLLALPEHLVALPGGRRSSQTDLWLLARTASGLVSVAVEGKVDESFGPTLADWLVDASDGKQARLEAICALLDLATPPSGIRYQLLHRTASAVLEARRFMAPHALMLVHSFSDSNSSWADYRAFLSLFGVDGGVSQVVSAGTRGGVHLHLGWVRSAFPTP